MESILQGIYRIFNIQAFFMMPQLRTSKMILKIMHVIALLLITIPSLLFMSNKFPLNGPFISSIIGIILLLRLINELRLPNIESNGRLNPPPSTYSNKKTRLNKIIQTLLLMFCVYGLNYYYTKDIPYKFILPELTGYIILIVSAVNYASCAYKFPISWNI